MQYMTSQRTHWERGGGLSQRHIYHILHEKNNIVFITKPSKPSFLLNNWPFISISPQVVIFHVKDQILILTLKGLSKLIWSPFKSSQKTTQMREWETNNAKMRQNRNIGSWVMLCVMWWRFILAAVATTERGRLHFLCKFVQLTCSNMQHTAQQTNIYETKFILYFTYLYINISSLK